MGLRCWPWGAGALALGVIGCAPPSTPVYVDIQAALRQTAIYAPARPQTPQPPKPMPGYTAVMPAQKPAKVEDRPGASGANIRETIQAAQAKAVKDIHARLRRFYETEVSRFELDQQKLVSDAEVKAYEEANAKIRAAFEEYAKERMPVFTQLTLIAGFPDPNPTSKPPETDLTPVLKQRFDESVALRKQLNEIDDRFQQTVETILGSVRDIAAEKLAAMRLAVEQFKEDLDKRAAEEAKAQVRETAGDMGLKLIEPLDLTLPGLPETKVDIPASPAFPPPPQLPPEGILTGEKDRERLLRQELDIWLGLNRYTLAEKPAGVKDATAEFLKWREKFEVGH